MQKKWLIRKEDPATVAKISSALGVTDLTAKILVHRGITEVDDAKIFLTPESAPFHNPFLMSGMSDAVDRIIVAIDGGEKICVYGDYDVDGMSASAILTRTLRKLGAVVENYIPARSEGYGLNVPALEKIFADGATLLITVDCGISNQKEISAVADKLDVIVTDHHLPALDKVTSAVAVLDPNQFDCDYPEKNLCGAGVAFKLSQALFQEMRGINFQEYMTDIEIAALATVADLVPLTGENRKIVRMGLAEMTRTKCLGLRSLIEVAELDGKKISTGHIAFQIAPRLNSIGRLESATEGLKLLLTEDTNDAQILAEKLNATNQVRKDIEAEMLVTAEKKVSQLREKFEGNLSSLVIAGENWNGGVIGLTASKLVEKYNLPTIILSIVGEDARGSCRSIPALHMKTALDTMAELFDQYGGHSQAAGFSIKTKKIPELARRFDDYVKQHLRDEDFLPLLSVDALLNPTELTLADAKEFAKFEPYGLGNPKPVLACRNIRGSQAKVIGKDGAHLSFLITEAEKNIRAVAWDKGNFAPLVESEFVDVAYEPELNEWQEKVSVQCVVNYLEPTAIEGEFPNREKLIEVYKFLKALSRQTNDFDLCDFVKKFNAATGKNFSTYTILNAINIFCELGFLRVDEGEKIFELPTFDKKLNLKNSRTFRLGMRNEF